MNDLDGLTLSELIARLNDIAVPTPVSYIPETVGWLVLAVIIVAVAALGAVLGVRRRSTSRYRRDALAELALIERRLTAGECEHASAELATLIRRTALKAFPREKVASLSGDDWKAFLIQSCTKDPGSGLDVLIIEPYRSAVLPSHTNDSATSVFATRCWIEHHHA